MVWIVAAPSELMVMASFLARSSLPSFWHRLGEPDIDPLILLLHLIYVFRAVYSNGGDL